MGEGRGQVSCGGEGGRNGRHTALLWALLHGLTAELCALLPGLTALCTGGEMADCSTHTGGMEAEPGGGFSVCGAMSTPPATGWCSPPIHSSLRYELSPPVQVGEMVLERHPQPLSTSYRDETLSGHRSVFSLMFISYDSLCFLLA